MYDLSYLALDPFIAAIIHTARHNLAHRKAIAARYILDVELRGLGVEILRVLLERHEPPVRGSVVVGVCCTTIILFTLQNSSFFLQNSSFLLTAETEA